MGNIWEDANEEQDERQDEEEEARKTLLSKLRAKVERSATDVANDYLKNHEGDAKMTRDNAIKFAQASLQRAKDWMQGKYHKDNKPHELLASVFMLGTYKDVCPFPITWDSDEEKYEVFHALRVSAAEGYRHGVVAGFMVIVDSRIKTLDTEVQSLEEAKKELQEAPGSIANDVTNAECLVLILSMPNEKPYVVFTRYTRDENGLPKFEESKEQVCDEIDSSLVPSDMWEEKLD